MIPLAFALMEKYFISTVGTIDKRYFVGVKLIQIKSKIYIKNTQPTNPESNGQLRIEILQRNLSSSHEILPSAPLTYDKLKIDNIWKKDISGSFKRCILEVDTKTVFNAIKCAINGMQETFKTFKLDE
uniref:Uncharacterized protein n=1 Tax=Romanomermis culicivorax TaxID=13658 RepID=A0A915JQE3_ROMCU